MQGVQKCRKLTLAWIQMNRNEAVYIKITLKYPQRRPLRQTRQSVLDHMEMFDLSTAKNCTCAVLVFFKKSTDVFCFTFETYRTFQKSHVVKTHLIGNVNTPLNITFFGSDFSVRICLGSPLPKIPSKLYVSPYLNLFL